MAWQDDMVTMLRVIIDDNGNNQEYSNSRLEEVIVVAATMTKKEIDFDNDYIISVSNVTISPDPVTNSDDAFVNIVTLKSACLLANSEYKTEAGRAITVRDGSSAIDNKGVAAAKKVWRDSICEDYSKAEREYRIGNSQAGKSIIGPYGHLSSNQSNNTTRNRPSY
jgi:hypothetical protein